MSRFPTRAITRGPCWLTAGALTLAACVRDSTAPRVGASNHHPHRVAAVVEVTFHDIGSPNMTSTAIVAPNVAALERMRATHRVADIEQRTPSFDLTVPTSATPGPATIQIALVAAGTVTRSSGGSTRYFKATYKVRNARADSSALDTPRRNLTFVAVSTANTIGDTPIRRFLKENGAPADPSLTRQLFPTGAVDVDNRGNLVSISPDVLQVLTEQELTAISVPAEVTNIFPYGYMVRKTGSTTTRTLPASPSAESYDGVVTFAFHLPVQANPADNPTTISVMLIALDDSETRITQSLEEQTPDATVRVRDRALSLGATTTTLMPGGTVSGVAGTRFVCSVRTAGAPSSATAYLVNVQSSFVSLTPSAYAPSSSFVPRTTNFAATFTAPVSAANATTMPVGGSWSGPAFVDQPYSGNGTTTVTTPTKTFFAGEEVEITISSSLSCPTPRVLRVRIATGRGQGDFFPATTASTRDSTHALAVGDFNRDGKLDIVATNLSSHNISVLLGNGDATFERERHDVVGRQPISVATGDLNGDGILDIAVANELDRTVSVLDGRGDGRFRVRRDFAVGTGRSIALADLNGNGVLDIVVANAEGTVSVLLNDGTGSFASQRIISASDAGKHTAIGTQDLNRDGAIDLVVTDSTSGRASVWLGAGNGTFGAETQFEVGAGPSSLGIGDFNADGILDLAVTNQTANTVSLLLGSGAGTFGARTTSTVGNWPGSLTIADFDGNGTLDITTANLADREASTLLGNGNGTFQGRRTFSIGESPRSIVSADFNNDTVIDLAVANGVRNGTVSVFAGRSQ